MESKEVANLAAQFQQEGPCGCDSFLQFDDDEVYALFYPWAVEEFILISLALCPCKWAWMCI